MKFPFQIIILSALNTFVLAAELNVASSIEPTASQPFPVKEFLQTIQPQLRRLQTFQSENSRHLLEQTTRSKILAMDTQRAQIIAWSCLLHIKDCSEKKSNKRAYAYLTMANFLLDTHSVPKKWEAKKFHETLIYKLKKVIPNFKKRNKIYKWSRIKYSPSFNGVCKVISDYGT